MTRAEKWEGDDPRCPTQPCQHDGPLQTSIVNIDRSFIASTSCLQCGHILGTASDG